MKTPETSDASRASRGVQIRVGFEGDPARDLPVNAYVFDQVGNFIASIPVDNGAARLPVSRDQARRIRLFIGPPAPGGKDAPAPTLDQMRKLDAYEPVWKYDPSKSLQELLPIPEMHWKFWLFCSCRIRGQVVRPVSLGGTISELPVCGARVHICEVDRLPWYILHLPDDLVFRLRDDLLRELAERFRRPIPIPDPPPFLVDPGFIDPSPENMALRSELAALKSHPAETSRVAFERGRQLFNAQSAAAGRFDKVALNPQPLPPRTAALLRRSKAAQVAFDPQPEPPGVSDLAKSSVFTSLTADVQSALLSDNASAVRNALAGQYLLLLPYLCLWPYLFWRFRCDEIAVLETDSQGRFDTTYTYLCLGDKPDLYFWVEYPIGGVWTTVYNPPLACNTYWNYVCGTEVTIRITDPRVPVCGNPPDPAGKVVVVMGIGENVSMNQIQAPGAGANAGKTDWGAPFGGVLEPRIQFGRTALFAANITHYKWTYRRLTLSDGLTPVVDVPHDLDSSVVRHYMVVDPTPPFNTSFPVEPMGPDPAFPGQNLFKIQPFTPSVPSDGWSVVDSHQDNATAFFPTHLLAAGNPEAAAGKYELKLELYDNTGSRVNLTTAGVHLRVPDVDAPFGAGTVTTIAAPADNQVIELGDLVGFKMTVHVDNNVCSGHIYDVEINSAQAGPCGFLDYIEGQAATTNALISFRASHPHNFATFDFDVVRGSAGLVASASAEGPVGAPAGGFSHAAGDYSASISVQTLLTDPLTFPPCTRGAFSEWLRVYATATDGWYRLSYLDAPRGGESGHKAFAIAPIPPSADS